MLCIISCSLQEASFKSQIPKHVPDQLDTTQAPTLRRNVYSEQVWISWCCNASVQLRPGSRLAMDRYTQADHHTDRVATDAKIEESAN